MSFAGAATIPFTLYAGLRSYFGWGISILLLVLVLLAGETVMGARRWLSLGGINFQPSELAGSGRCSPSPAISRAGGAT
jgi:cell division protein FtsW (lipid II flippase)